VQTANTKIKLPLKGYVNFTSKCQENEVVSLSRNCSDRLQPNFNTFLATLLCTNLINIQSTNMCPRWIENDSKIFKSVFLKKRESQIRMFAIKYSKWLFRPPEMTNGPNVGTVASYLLYNSYKFASITQYYNEYIIIDPDSFANTSVLRTSYTLYIYTCWVTGPICNFAKRPCSRFSSRF
jgi:hypothetical protein